MIRVQLNTFVKFLEREFFPLTRLRNELSLSNLNLQVRLKSNRLVYVRLSHSSQRCLMQYVLRQNIRYPTLLFGEKCKSQGFCSDKIKVNSFTRVSL
jgi:hypothetical protein